MAIERSDGLLKQEQVIFEAVEEIDKYLIDDSLKPSLRPFQAAILFVEHFVLDVSGGSKDNFAEQSWFAVVYHHVKEWYDKTYGALMEDKGDGLGRAVVLVRGVPAPLDVPLTRCVVEEEGVSAWLCFPVEIEDGERPTTWLGASPCLSSLSSKDLSKLERVCARTAVAMRKINVNVQSLSGMTEVIDGLTSGIMPEIQNAARNITSNRPEAFGLAAWSMQMALERTLNALALQRKNKFKKTHDLFALFDLVDDELVSINRDTMKKFLRQDEVMDARYSQGQPVNKDFILKSFLDCIEFIAFASSKFDRSISIAGGKILIKKPPWVTLPS